MNLPINSCLICGEQKELAVWVDPAKTGGEHFGVCFTCREDAKESKWIHGSPEKAGWYLAASKVNEREDDETYAVSELWFNPDSIERWWTGSPMRFEPHFLTVVAYRRVPAYLKP